MGRADVDYPPQHGAIAFGVIAGKLWRRLRKASQYKDRILCGGSSHRVRKPGPVRRFCSIQDV